MTDSSRPPDRELPSLDRLVVLAGREVRRATERATATAGLGATAMRILGELAEHGPVSHRDLAGFVGVTPATLTPMMDVLEDAGAVTRRRNPQDRRVVLAAVTRHGQELLDGASTAVRTGVRERMPQPGPEHAGVIREFLLAVVRTFENDALGAPE